VLNAVIIHEDDSVAIAIEEIAKGEMVSLKTLDKKDMLFEALNDIPMYHKIALKPIKKGQPILKYGEHIGQASEDIEKGSHVHEHNVESVREDLHV
jgi:altronate dehydratase small subunit